MRITHLVELCASQFVPLHKPRWPPNLLYLKGFKKIYKNSWFVCFVGFFLNLHEFFWTSACDCWFIAVSAHGVGWGLLLAVAGAHSKGSGSTCGFSANANRAFQGRQVPSGLGLLHLTSNTVCPTRSVSVSAGVGSASGILTLADSEELMSTKSLRKITNKGS